jgi:hypothetical protein
MNRNLSLVRVFVNRPLLVALCAACTPVASSPQPPAPLAEPSPAPLPTANPSSTPTAEPAPGTSPAALAFRDSVDEAPPGWSGPKFKLSHGYPSARPTCNAPWLKRKVSFTDRKQVWNAGWAGYIKDIVDYVREGQEVDLPDNVGFRSEVAGQTRWFHVPWMAYDGQRGREFVHGLTNELSTAESTFNDSGRGTGLLKLPGAKKVNGQDPLFETWSVGFYNSCGAFSVGQTFPASGEPSTYTEPTTKQLLATGMPFAEGTVVVKILNTTADETNVPYLKGSTTWQANGHKQLSPSSYSQCERAITRVHLVQMDLAVIDPRSPTRWVYSTLSYDGTLPGKTVWDRLKPLGVQWGSDAGTFPAVDKAQSKPAWESVLAPVKVPQHYGCEKRLAGVVDQANSSCVSCHMAAYAAPAGVLQVQGVNVPNVFHFDGMCTTYNAANKSYFADYAYPAPAPGTSFKDAIALDSSLQVQVAFQQYAVYKHPEQPRTCPNPGAAKAP